MLLLLAEIFRHPPKQHQRSHDQLLGNSGAERTGGVREHEVMPVVKPIVRILVRTGGGKVQPAELMRPLEQSAGEIAQQDLTVPERVGGIANRSVHFPQDKAVFLRQRANPRQLLRGKGRSHHCHNPHKNPAFLYTLRRKNAQYGYYTKFSAQVQ